MTQAARGWHSRGYLPHFDGGEIAQTVTFRLGDSLPEAELRRWRAEFISLGEEAERECRRRVERYLDLGAGACWLRDARFGSMVQDALLYFDGVRYRLSAWVVMPNHVHGLFTPAPGITLTAILHSWKSYTAHEACRILGDVPAFWQPDYFDRYIRSEEHFLAAVAYIETNPVKAGLCVRPEDWPFSSANARASWERGRPARM